MRRRAKEYARCQKTCSDEVSERVDKLKESASMDFQFLIWAGGKIEEPGGEGTEDPSTVEQAKKD